MAQRVNVILVDDLDGGDAVETVSFGLDGVDYEIDLSEAHASTCARPWRSTSGTVAAPAGGAVAGPGGAKAPAGSASAAEIRLGQARERLGRAPSGAGSRPRCARPTTPRTDRDPRARCVGLRRARLRSGFVRRRRHGRVSGRGSGRPASREAVVRSGRSRYQGRGGTRRVVTGVDIIVRPPQGARRDRPVDVRHTASRHTGT